MKRFWLLAAILLVMVTALTITGLANRLASAQGTNDSATPPADYQPIPVEPGLAATEQNGTQATSAALIMDFLPWGSSAIQTELTALGLPYTIYNSSALGSNPNIWNHDLIIVAEDQPTSFYVNLAANMPKFDQYLKTKCAVVVFNMSAWGWNGGNALNVVLPGGVGMAPSYQWNNYIVNPTHPIVTTPNLIPNPMSGTYASHVYFTNIGAASVIAVEGTGPGGNPTLIEYPYGAGHVIAGGQTYSYGWTYAQDAGKMLVNLLKYAKELKLPCAKSFTYSIKLVCGTNKKTTVDVSPVLRGIYSTEVNLHNPTQLDAILQKRIILLVRDGLAIGREPNFAGVTAQDAIVLPPDTATMDDCQRIGELVYNIPPGFQFANFPLTIGFLEVISSAELRVDAVYTTNNTALSAPPIIEIEHILPQGQ